MIFVNAHGASCYPSDLGWFLDQCRRADVEIRCESGRVLANAPAGIMNDAFRGLLKAHKPALIAKLSAPAEDWSRERAEAATEDLPITIERDWRWEVANLPAARWSTWHARTAELQPANPSVEQIQEAEWSAYCELVLPLRYAPL